jgi:hypothetical protein
MDNLVSVSHNIAQWDWPYFQKHKCPPEDGLSGVAEEELRASLEPVMRAIRELNAEDLIKLRRVSISQGARLKEG